ncbi:eukaryotic initiation factor 4A-III homolog [Raphanus sativus]|uniref:RNA helicase n=1 Tax=Raphanus sativus TaxID=3726 RepID=A0A9W3DF86_RAPSA|nr:eukaryotic initiation factor 4A-III homolog [Raphanus sativus]
MTTFQSMAIGENLLLGISECGFQKPTRVQEACTEKIAGGESLFVTARSGSGKSAAIAIAVIQKVNASNPKIQVIILSARFKLAVELEKAIQQLGRHKNVRAHAMSAGSPWMQGTQILIGVPNFLLEKMRSGTVNVSNAHVIIVDDAEEMDRFSGSINELINFTSANINQVCFLGSTIPSSLVAHARDFDVHIDDISVVEKHKDVEHYEYDVKNDVEKMKRLREILMANDNAIIFCNSKSTARFLHSALELPDHVCAMMDGELLPRKRDILVDSLRSGDLKYLITTDVESSKLRASLVVMYDIPTCLEVYMDRSHRVCRGKAVSLVKPSDKSRMKLIKDTPRSV